MAGDEPWTSLLPTERETWIGRDGGGRFVSRDVGRPRFPGPRDRARWEAAGRPRIARSSGPAAGSSLRSRGFTAGASSLSHEQPADLPAPYLDAEPGFVTGYRLVLEQGIVRSDTARP